MPTGRYQWNVDFRAYDSSDQLIQSLDWHDGTYDVVNRLYADPATERYNEFGAGWYLPELDRLYVYQDGINWVSGMNQPVWFSGSGPTYDPTYQPYLFADLTKNQDDTYTLTNPDGTKSHFSTEGLLTSREDRHGNAVRTYAYDDVGDIEDALVSITDAVDRVTTFNYDENAYDDWMLASIEDFAGAETLFEFNEDGRLVTVTQPDPDGAGTQYASPVTEYGYDATTGLMTKIIDPRSLETTIAYDHTRLVSEMVLSCGGTIEITSIPSQTVVDLSVEGFNKDNRATLLAEADVFEVRNDFGNVSHIQRDLFGNITYLSDALENVTTSSYKFTGIPGAGLLNLMTEPDPDGDGPLSNLVTDYDFDGTGHLTRIIHPGSLMDEQWTYDTLETTYAGDIVVLMQYSDGTHLTKYVYDEDYGDLLQVIRINDLDDRDYPSDTDIDEVTTYTYTDSISGVPDGLVETIEDSLGRITRYQYDGDLVQFVTFAEGTADETTIEYEYDARDNVSAMIDGLGRRTDNTYDNLDRLITRTEADPDGNGPQARPVWKYRYDQVGNQTHVTDPLGRVTETVYDSRGRVFQTIQPVADPSVTPSVSTKVYNQYTSETGTWSNTTRTGTVGGSVRASSTDGASITYAFSGLTASKKYDVLVRWVPDSGDPDAYDTNALFEVFGNTGGDPLNDMRVNLNRKTEGMPDGSGYMWLSLGAFSPYSNTLTVKLSDDDTNGHLVIDSVRLVEVGPVTQSEFDCNSNLVKSIDPLGNTTTYEYDDLNRLIEKTEPNAGSGSPVTQYFYNSLGWMTSMVDAEGGGTRYEYDEMGRVVTEQKIGGAGLMGEYYVPGGNVSTFPDFDALTPTSTRVDSDINFGPTSTSFAGISGLDNDFAARWTAGFFMETASDISFAMLVYDYDGGRVYIDGQLIVEAISTGSYVTDDGTIHLEAGWHTIEVQYYDEAGYDWAIVVCDADGGTSYQSLAATGLFRTLSTTRYSYTEAGETETVTDPEGRTTSYTYDDLGRLETETGLDPDGPSNPKLPTLTTYGYDDVGNVLTVTQRLDGSTNFTTTYTYDDLNRVETVTNANGDDPTVYTYDLAGNRKTLTDPVGNVTSWVYDDLNRVIEETNELNLTRFYQYDAVGNVSRTIDRNGRITRYEYDRLNRQTEETWQEDGVGDKVKSRYAFYANHAGSADSNIAVDENDYPKQALLPGETATIANNVGGYLTGLIIDLVDVGTLTSGDFEFKTTSVSSPGTWTTYSPTLSFNVRPGEGKDGSDRVEITGLSVSNKWLQVTVKATANTNLSSPDVFYFSTKAGDGDGDGDSDGPDFVIWQTNNPAASGHTWETGDFDGDGDVDGADFVVWQTAGSPVSYITAAADTARTISHTYDDLGRLTDVTDRDGANQLAGAEYTYLYDELNRLDYVIVQSQVGLTPPIGFDYSYDALGRRTGLTNYIDTGSGTTDFVNSYTYDPLGRLTKITQSSVVDHVVAQKRVDFTYNAAGQFLSINRYESLLGSSNLVGKSTYGYDLAGRITSLAHQRNNAGSLTGLATYSFGWDAVNRLTEFDNSAYAGENVDYGYDSTGQLTGATYTTQANETYDYDDNGNRDTGYTTGSDNRMTGDGTYTYAYDGEGNLVKRTDASGNYRVFEWDHRNRLVSVSDYNSSAVLQQKVSYLYDAFDRLIGKRVNSDGDSDVDATEAYVYDGNQIVLRFADTDDAALASADLANRYLWGPAVDQLLAEEQVTSLGSAGDVLWAAGDHLNTIRDWFNYNSGTNTATHADHAEYDSFGNRLDSPSVDSIFGWTGRIRDAATGLQWNGSALRGGRWYDSGTGRWLSEDSIGFQGDRSNLYRYVGNGATINVDPSGMERGRSDLTEYDDEQQREFMKHPWRPPQPRPALTCPTGCYYAGYRPNADIFLFFLGDAKPGSWIGDSPPSPKVAFTYPLPSTLEVTKCNCGLILDSMRKAAELLRTSGRKNELQRQLEAIEELEEQCKDREWPTTNE